MANTSNLDPLDLHGMTNDNTDVEPAPTECVMIKEEPDMDLEYESCERNALEEDDHEMNADTTTSTASTQPTIFHGTYLPPSGNEHLKRSADGGFKSSYPTVGKVLFNLPVSPPEVHSQLPPKKKPVKQIPKTYSSKPNQNVTEEEEEESALRIKYLMNASDTEERMRNLQMELNKAKLEREKMELENLKEMHRMRIENMKLEKEILAMKLKTVTEKGVGVI